MVGLRTILGNLLDRVAMAMMVLAGAMLAFITVIVSMATISRKWFGMPMAWSIELTEYALLYITFLAAAYLVRHDVHVRLELVDEFLPRRALTALTLFGNVLGLAVSAALAGVGVYMTIESYRRGIMVTSIWVLPRWIFLSAIPLGSSVMALEFVRQIVHRTADLLNKS